MLKKTDDLKIPSLNDFELSKKQKQVRAGEAKPCTSKSTGVLPEDEYLDDEEIKKQKQRLNQLNVAPIINLDELQFLGSSSLAIETENGLYHHKEEKNVQVNK